MVPPVNPAIDSMSEGESEVTLVLVLALGLDGLCSSGG